MVLIEGVGPDTPTVTNEAGAKQSRLAYRADLLPPLAILAVARVLHGGAEKYGPDNWRGIATADHINHAIVHMFAFLAGDAQDEHLAHAVCRLLFALDLDLENEWSNRGATDPGHTAG